MLLPLPPPRTVGVSCWPDAEPPTSYSVDGGDLLAMQALCHGVVTWQRLEELKRAGARGLMVLPVERMLA